MCGIFVSSIGGKTTAGAQVSGAPSVRIASSQSLSDPLGDAADPRGDILRAGLTYGSSGAIFAGVAPAQDSDPATDPIWKFNTGVVVKMFPTADPSVPAAWYLELFLSASGQPVAEVTDSSSNKLCDAQFIHTSGIFGGAFPESCIGSPGQLWWQATMEFSQNSSTQSIDRAPDTGRAGPTAKGPDGPGYWLLGRDGGVFSYGSAVFHGSTGAMRLNQPIVGMAARPDANGYWFVASDGGIFSFNAPFFGSTGAIRLNKPIVGMAATPTGGGYWLVASDGGIFSFGDAAFYGSTGAMTLTEPIAGIVSSPTGHGYWLYARDGGVFTFGDARFNGSGAGFAPSPVVGMVSTHLGGGYWQVTSDGHVGTFGVATKYGDAVGKMRSPVVGIILTNTSLGYWLVSASGEVLGFGDAQNLGNAASIPLAAPIVGVGLSG